MRDLRRTGLTRAIRLLARIAVLACLLLVAGGWFPTAPLIGWMGTHAFTFAALWLALGALALGAFLTLPAMRGGGGTGGLIWPLAAGVAGIGAIIPVAQIAAIAAEEGVELSLVDAFASRATLATLPPDEEHTISDEHGDSLPIALYQGAGGSGRPILVYLHGGGWIWGSPDQRGPDMEWFAEQGYLVVALGYRLSDQENHLWDRTLAQTGCGLAWLNANAARLGGDAGQITLLGDSAGGNLALNAGFRIASGTMPQSCAGELPAIAAVGAVYPVVDVASFHNNPDDRFGSYSRLMARQYTGGTPQEFPQRYAPLNPTAHITANAPPTVIIEAGADHLVPPSLAPLQARAQEVGADLKTITLPHYGHGFDEVTGFGNAIMRQEMLRLMRASE